MWLRLSIILIVLGCCLGYYTYQEHGLAVNAKAEPERIALKDLIARGPNGNPHLILTDFTLGKNFVYSQKENGTTWEAVWVPLHPEEEEEEAPAQGRAPRPAGVQALLFSKHCPDQAVLATRCAVEELHGMVTNRVQALEADEMKLLAESYPGTDFTRCIIFEEGRSPSGWAVLVAQWVGALVLVGLGVLLLLWRVLRRTA